MRDIDLIIIGSGPAGISTALHLLQQDPGWADRDDHDRKSLPSTALVVRRRDDPSGMEVFKRLSLQFPLPILRQL